MKVEIKNPIVQSRTIKGKNGDFELHQLEGWAHIDPDGYPEKITMQVEQGAQYTAGEYELQPKSFYVGDFGKLQMGKAILTPALPASSVKKPS